MPSILNSAGDGRIPAKAKAKAKDHLRGLRGHRWTRTGTETKATTDALTAEMCKQMRTPDFDIVG